jgi:hypothetical protein
VITKLGLRQVREQDRWLLWGWRNSERIRTVSVHDEEIPREKHDAWFTERLPGMHNKTVIVEWSGAPVGWFQVEHWDESKRSGEWGVALGEQHLAPLGLGGALPLLALSHAFTRLRAGQMTGRVLDLNKNMLSIMRRLEVPVIDRVEEPSRQARGEDIGMTVYRVERSDWPHIHDLGSSLVPSSLRAAIAAACSQPLSK